MQRQRRVVVTPVSAYEKDVPPELRRYNVTKIIYVPSINKAFFISNGGSENLEDFFGDAFTDFDQRARIGNYISRIDGNIPVKLFKKIGGSNDKVEEADETTEIDHEKINPNISLDEATQLSIALVGMKTEYENFAPYDYALRAEKSPLFLNRMQNFFDSPEHILLPRSVLLEKLYEMQASRIMNDPVVFTDSVDIECNDECRILLIKTDNSLDSRKSRTGKILVYTMKTREGAEPEFKVSAIGNVNDAVSGRVDVKSEPLAYIAELAGFRVLDTGILATPQITAIRYVIMRANIHIDIQCVYMPLFEPSKKMFGLLVPVFSNAGNKKINPIIAVRIRTKTTEFKVLNPRVASTVYDVSKISISADGKFSIPSEYPNYFYKWESNENQVSKTKSDVTLFENGYEIVVGPNLFVIYALADKIVNYVHNNGSAVWSVSMYNRIVAVLFGDFKLLLIDVAKPDVVKYEALKMTEAAFAEPVVYISATRLGIADAKNGKFRMLDTLSFMDKFPKIAVDKSLAIKPRVSTVKKLSTRERLKYLQLLLMKNYIQEESFKEIDASVYLQISKLNTSKYHKYTLSETEVVPLQDLIMAIVSGQQSDPVFAALFKDYMDIILELDLFAVYKLILSLDKTTFPALVTRDAVDKYAYGILGVIGGNRSNYTTFEPISITYNMTDAEMDTKRLKIDILALLESGLVDSMPAGNLKSQYWEDLCDALTQGHNAY